MKKRLLRLSKRILILTLCTTLLSGSVINRYKITANATSIAVGVGTYTAYEICLYIGGTLLTACGLGAIYENRDQIAQVGKDFIDSMNLDEVSDWLFTKVTTTGQSYVYGTEALQEIQDMSFSVIQGGGNRPDNDDDNNDDDEQGDGEHMVDVLGLGELAVFGTVAFYDLFEQYAEPLIEGIRNGEENFVSNAFNLYSFSFGGYEFDSNGNYIINLSYSSFSETSESHNSCLSYALGGYYLPCIYLEPTSTEGRVRLNYIATKLNSNGELSRVELPISGVSIINGVNYDSSWKASSSEASVYQVNIPVFSSIDVAIDYLKSGDFSSCLNTSKSYIIADWLQENWGSALTQLNTGIRSLADNMLIVGEAANQALINQSNGLGYIEDLGNRIATTAPLALPDSIADPIYYPATSPVPELAPEELPWYTPAGNPGTDNPSGGGTGDDGSISEDVIRGSDSFGISTIFGILILLIMILLMLLMIFLSCLAFIITIFRIPATTGFLPAEMVSGLDYLKTLEIPGFGMSVYGFFMALIYIILIFTVIGILRKNIDKIKFPRKGKW